MYITTLIITTSESKFIDKLKKILKRINYEIKYYDYEFNKLTKQITYAVFKIETFHNIRNLLSLKLNKNFDNYPIDICNLIISKKKRNLNKYFILSKLKKNKNYYLIRTEYTSKVNPNILW